MPWQKHVLDVALEEKPNGRLKYPDVVLTVPRQNGKTTIVPPLAMLTVLTKDVRAVTYAAQSISDAVQKWRFEMMPKLEKSKLGRAARLKFYKSLALAGIECARTGSHLRIIPSNESSGHGLTASLAFHDEAWDAKDSTREQASKPAGITIEDFQYWVMSVAGTVDSIYLREKVEAGRKVVQEQRSEQAGMAYFEYAIPEDADWCDQSLWAAANPAIGITIDMERLIQLSESMPPDDFRRHHLNQWIAIASEWAIPEMSWEHARTYDKIPPGPFWAAADAPSPHRGDGAIAVYAGGVVEIIDTGNGRDWALEKLRALAIENTMNLEGILLWKHGQLKSVGDALIQDGHPVNWLAGSEMPIACGNFYEAVVKQFVKVRPSAALDSAIRRAEFKDRESGMSSWRSRDGMSIAALWAASMAYSKGDRDDGEADTDGPAITGIDDYDPDELDSIAKELGL